MTDRIENNSLGNILPASTRYAELSLGISRKIFAPEVNHAAFAYCPIFSKCLKPPLKFLKFVSSFFIQIISSENFIE